MKNRHILRPMFVFFFITMLKSIVFCQQLSFVKDNIMDEYMRSGFSNTHFIPEGKKDKDSNKQGRWKDYEVVEDYELINIDNYPSQISGHFLRYEEGKYIDNKKDGDWEFYLVEDKSFKKILQQRVHYKKGIRTGEFKFYYPNGEIAEIGKCENDSVQGEVKMFYENGNIFALIHYRMDKKEGAEIHYYSGGVIESQMNFKGDSTDGAFISYYENKAVREQSYSKMGAPDSIYRYYYSNGQLWTEKQYKNGLLLNVTAIYDKEGKPRDKGTLKDGSGTVNYYTEDGTLYTTQTFKDGKKVSEKSTGVFK